MFTARRFLRLGALVASANLLACANDTTAPLISPNDDPSSVPAGRVPTSLEIKGGRLVMAPLAGLNKTRLEIRAKDQYGMPMVTGNGPFSISSDNPGVATAGDAQFWTASFNEVPYDSWVSADVTALAPGEAVISVSWTTGGVTRTANTTIRVESTEGWSLKADPSTFALKLGAAKAIRATIVDAAGNHRFTPQGVLFAPDRIDRVALFSEELCDWQPCHGINVRGVAVGEATIAAEYQGFSTMISVTVVP